MPEAEACWRGRFAGERILTVRVGQADRGRGVLAVQDGSGVGLAAWRVGDPLATPLGIGTDGFDQSWWIGADGRSVLHLVDDHGDELGHVHRSAVDDPAGRRDLTPDWPRYALRGGAASAGGRRHVMVTVGADGFALVLLGDDAAAPRVLYRSDHQAWNPRIDRNGVLACVDTTDHEPAVRRFAVSAFDVETGRSVGRLVGSAGGTVTATCFSPLAGDPRILVTEYGQPQGFARPLLWNPRTGARHEVAAPVVPDTDLIALDWSPDGRYVLLGQGERAAQSLLVHDLRTDDTVGAHLPAGSYWLPAQRTAVFGPAGSVLACRESAAAPPAVWRWSARNGAERLLAGPAVPPGRDARSVTFPSSDGTRIQAWLLVPAGPGPHPTVVRAHGGPHVFTPDGYSPVGQSWVDHGFAYLDVNYRGSTGRGWDFAERVWGDVGRWELEDLAAAHRWLTEQGVARPRQVVMSGESYGGYLTLYCLARQPQLWAAGVAEIAVADWTATYRDAAPALRAAVRTWFGGTPDQVPDLYRDRSPLTHAEHITAPVLIRQGRRDTRTPPAQLRAFEAQMRALGKRIEVDWFDGGHGYGGGDDAADAQQRVVAFVRAVLAASP